MKYQKLNRLNRDIHCGNATVPGSTGFWVLPGGKTTTNENTAELVAERIAVLIGRTKPIKSRQPLAQNLFKSIKRKDSDLCPKR